MDEPILIAAFYKFAPLPDFENLRSPLLACMQKYGVRGSILLAAEGVNGTIAGPDAGVHAVLGKMRADARLSDLPHKASRAKENPFYRPKVRLKKEIVSLGKEEADPLCVVGKYIPPAQWNRVIADPEVVVVDTRNDYEFAIGTFEGAINPETTNFREFPEYVAKELDPAKHKKVAMFCTGGIRCEKATAYMLRQGFEEVMHLEGGILKYLEDIPQEKSLWRGECFVFDNRVSVDHALKPGSYELCHACRMPISAADKASPHYEEGVSCPHCHDQKTQADRARFAQRQKQIELAEKRGDTHIGA